MLVKLHGCESAYDISILDLERETIVRFTAQKSGERALSPACVLCKQ